jgi:2-dehydropantoate 2-reductase
MEIDALLGAVQELGEITENATPTIDTLLALLRLRAVHATR